MRYMTPQGGGGMADVFISYKRGDAARVRKLVAALRDQGLDAWWDEDIPPSAPWEATIECALAGAKAVIVCWSPDAVASENVRSEARVAREDGRLIQLFLKPCSPPLFFGERQGVDLSNWRGKADDPRIGKIAERVRAVAAGWLPDRQFFATDIADEPCFARLRDEPRFAEIRQAILARIDAERRKVKPELLVASGLRAKGAA
jgi:hypothetical protein